MFHNKGYRWPDEIPVGISEDTPDDKQSATPLLLNSIKQVDTAIIPILQDGEVTAFSEKLWCGLLDYTTAYADGRLTFTFKNGSTFEG